MAILPSSHWLPQDIVQAGTGFVLLGFIGIILLVIGRAFYNVFLHPLRDLPGPLLWRITSIPYDYYGFIGMLPRTVRKLHQQYGPVIRLAPDAISTTDSQVWKDVWSARNPEFPKDSRRTQLPPNGFYSILNAPKDEHARFRRLLAHAFSEKGLREQEARIHEYMDLLVERLDEKAQSRESTNIVDWYTMTVFDVIGDLAWGESFNGLRDGHVHEWISALLGNTKYTGQGATITRYGLSALKPYLLDSSVTTSRKKNYELAVAKAEKRAQYSGEPRGDFWDRVLIKSANDNAAGEGMNKEEMVNNASVLVLGGAETSATTLSGTTYLLLNHPEVMKRLSQEIRSSFKSTDEIDVHSVNRLNYMLAVIDEAMRIYPPVPDTAQRAAPPGGGMVCGHFIPELTTIHASQLSASHVESNFHRPGDFIPERWLPNPPSEFSNDDKYASQPFSVGNRNCIGKNLAYAEMRLILAKVLYHFDLELDGTRNGKDFDWFDQKSYGVWHKGPLYVKLRRAAPL